MLEKSSLEGGKIYLGPLFQRFQVHVLLTPVFPACGKADYHSQKAWSIWQLISMVTRKQHGSTIWALAPNNNALLHEGIKPLVDSELQAPITAPRS